MTYSPAALQLMGEGVTLAEVAARLGVTRQSVSLYLAGRVTPHPSLAEALEDLLSDPEAAAKVLAAIDGPNR